ncbi:sensor domain-containing diguanylate cyclase [Photobacterium gaetbulicola]|uniref:diguanylate cyclase n=1 Tax=Photobacterium gaetbulicola Gung47 TaxID=658445 RepID=A0A0C5X0F6_9GAMM|nr:diguanylate cyclase [Photobacterium gaetbulicola]AJR08780.1 hypothetical protein H744_2c2116 [Photobacterium gaetbulicola Gung47]PSU10410.1 sensor domain-containing diguanylate cyclase [Photobacterium gaetbulicola]
MKLEQHIKKHNGKSIFQVIIAVISISVILSQVTELWLDESIIIDNEIEKEHVKQLLLLAIPFVGIGLLVAGRFFGKAAIYQKMAILVIVSIVATIHTLSISMFSDISIISLILITLVAKLLIFSPAFSLLVYANYVLQANIMVVVFHSDIVLYSNYYFSLSATYLWLNYLSINNYKCFVNDYLYEQKKKTLMARAVLLNREIEAKNIMLNYHAYIDEVTGLYNRRYLQERMTLLNQDRQSCQLGVLLIDIDHFKQVNDVYGHAIGDTYLKQVSQALRTVFKRQTDVIARYGGEEIVVLLTGPMESGLDILASQACEAVRQLGLQHPRQATLSISTGGVYIEVPTEPVKAYLDIADNCMYKVKSRGRDGYYIESITK